MKAYRIGLVGAVIQVLGLVLSLSGGLKAHAQNATEIDINETDMTFTIVREASGKCEPICPEWISAFGTIEVNSDDKLEAAFKKMGNRQLPVIIESPGGDVDAALRMGRIIRQKGLDIAVGHTFYKNCRPENPACPPMFTDNIAYPGTVTPVRAYCASACAYLLAGGVKRFVDQSSVLGVHLGQGKTYTPGFTSGYTPSEVDEKKAADIATQFKPSVLKYLRKWAFGPSWSRRFFRL